MVKFHVLLLFWWRMSSFSLWIYIYLNVLKLLLTHLARENQVSAEAVANAQLFRKQQKLFISLVSICNIDGRDTSSVRHFIKQLLSFQGRTNVTLDHKSCWHFDHRPWLDERWQKKRQNILKNENNLRSYLIWRENSLLYPLNSSIQQKVSFVFLIYFINYLFTTL